MPLTQNAPRDPGCSGLGAILVTLPFSTVSNEPHSAEHSQQVLGTVSVAATFEGRTFIAITSFDRMLHARNRSASARLRDDAFISVSRQLQRQLRGSTERLPRAT